MYPTYYCIKLQRQSTKTKPSLVSVVPLCTTVNILYSYIYKLLYLRIKFVREILFHLTRYHVMYRVAIVFLFNDHAKKMKNH